MTIKIFIGFMMLHIFSTLGELWARSAAGENVAWEEVGALNRFNSSIEAFQHVLQNPFGILGGLGSLLVGLFEMFAFTGYPSVYDGGWEFIRVIFASIGFAVLFLTLWRVMGGVLASTISNISGRLGRVIPFG